jgi:diacylglycerol kinase (ATP)
MKAVIIANPGAGGGRPYRALLRHISRFRRADWDIDLIPTESPEHAGTIALGLLEHPPDLLAVCGGDGTVNEIVTTVPDPPFPVALLPGGTANVLARELGLPLDPVRALDIGFRRSVRRVDLGRLGPGRRRRFLFVAGIGFDADAVSGVDPALKGRFGMAAYAFEILRCLKKYPFREFRVTVDGRSYTATNCLVCNAKRYGGGLLFCPDADMRDGLLDVLILRNKSRIQLARFLFLAWLKIAERREWILRVQGSAVTVDGPGEICVQTDGEPAGQIPVEIGLTPSAFPLVVP